MLNRYSPQTSYKRRINLQHSLSSPSAVESKWGRAQNKSAYWDSPGEHETRKGENRQAEHRDAAYWLSLSGHGLFVTHLRFQGAQRWRQPPPGGSHWLHTAAHGGFIVLNMNVHMSSIVMLLFYFLKLFRWVSGLYTFLLKTIRKSKICVVFCHDGFA